MLRDWRRFNREAPALIGMNGTAPSLGAWLEREGLLPPLHRPPDRPPGLRRLVRRPGADVELPGQLHGRVLRQPRHVQPPRPAALADGRAAARAATSRRSPRPGATACACARRCGGSSACPTGCGSRPTAARPRSFDRVVIATHSDQALALLADPSEAEREILGAIPYQRNEAVLHTDASLMPRRRAAWSSWNFHLAEQPPAAHHRHLLDEPPAAAAGRAPVLPHAQPRRGDRPGEGAAPLHLRPPRLHRRRASPRRPATPRSAACAAPTTAAPTGAGASTRTASSAPCGPASGSSPDRRPPWTCLTAGVPIDPRSSDTSEEALAA